MCGLGELWHEGYVETVDVWHCGVVELWRCGVVAQWRGIVDRVAVACSK
jgi:hypothetical protein